MLSRCSRKRVCQRRGLVSVWRNRGRRSGVAGSVGGGGGGGGDSTNMDCSRMQCVCSSLHTSPALCLEQRRTPRFVKHEHTMWNAQGRSLTNGSRPHEMMSGAWFVCTSLPFVRRRWQSGLLSVSFRDCDVNNCGRDSRQNGRLEMEAWDECCSQ